LPISSLTARRRKDGLLSRNRPGAHCRHRRRNAIRIKWVIKWVVEMPGLCEYRSIAAIPPIRPRREHAFHAEWREQGDAATMVHLRHPCGSIDRAR